MKHIPTRIIFISLILISLIPVLQSCFSEDLKKQMNDSMKKMQVNLADQTFRRTLGEIELHKLRYGIYPTSLGELKFQNQLDSASFHSIEYHLLDSGYELNISSKAVNFDGQQTDISLEYPAEFWHGLGCIKSNMKRSNLQATE